MRVHQSLFISKLCIFSPCCAQEVTPALYQRLVCIAQQYFKSRWNHSLPLLRFALTAQQETLASEAGKHINYPRRLMRLLCSNNWPRLYAGSDCAWCRMLGTGLTSTRRNTRRPRCMFSTSWTKASFESHLRLSGRSTSIRPADLTGGL